MAAIHRGRYAAHVEGDFVVFIIGVRLTRLWKFHRWLYVFLRIWPMLRQLREDPNSGLLGSEYIYMRGFALVLYWRSFDHLARFAGDPRRRHLPAWRWFNDKVAASGDLGIWHETYLVRAGDYECVYGNMPRMGLALAAQHVPLDDKGQTAAKRIGLSTDDEPPLPGYPTPPAS